MVEVEEGGHLLFVSQVEPLRQIWGVSDGLGGGRPWVVILSLITMHIASHWTFSIIIIPVTVNHDQ